MTDFTTAVQDVVRTIPPGSTMTYQAVATTAGYPRAARAVAQVMARNFDPAIPCHRIIRSDGSLGGYNRGGPEVKAALLHNEGWLAHS